MGLLATGLVRRRTAREGKAEPVSDTALTGYAVLTCMLPTTLAEILFARTPSHTRAGPSSPTIYHPPPRSAPDASAAIKLRAYPPTHFIPLYFPSKRGGGSGSAR